MFPKRGKFFMESQKILGVYRDIAGKSTYVDLTIHSLKSSNTETTKSIGIAYHDMLKGAYQLYQ